MRKYIVSLWLMIASIALTYGQISEGGTPKSFSYPELKSTGSINSYTLDKLNKKKLLRQDNKNGLPLRYSKYTDVDIDIKEEGSKRILNKGTIWQYKITSENGLSISLQFKKFNLPEGASLFIYNPDRDILFGAFTSKNNKSGGNLSIADFPDTVLIIEYYEPEDVDFEGAVVIGKIGQGYRDIYGSDELDESTEDDGYIDINCPEGDQVQLEKHAVAKITFESDGSGYVCTGSLINNVRNDGTPYFLTANHCISKNSEASTTIAYFNYEKNDCGGIVQNAQTLSGATLKSTYSGSDFTLIEFDNSPPVSYHPYYAGWNALSDSIVESGYGIHHPSGDVKKISLSYKEVTSYPEEIYWEDETVSETNTHWDIVFDKGETAGGSSGSPLFDPNNRIIGQLHGGTSLENFYGKLSRSWNDGPFSYQNLKKWLDPDNTGTLIYDGYSPSGQDVVAHFYSDFQSVCIGEPIQLYDGSLYSPEQWSWSIVPSTVSFHEETDANSQNPVVSFDEEADYTIILESTNSTSSDTRTRHSYVSASYDNLDLEINSLFDTLICSSSFQGEYRMIGKGAENFSWKIDSDSGMIYIDSLSLSNDTLVFSANESYYFNSSPELTITLTGQHGTCTDSTNLTMRIINPGNDSIKNAYDLKYGTNGPYYNLCASREESEPNPIVGSCNTQFTWCECGEESILIENSVWFKFEAPSSGIVTIDALGFDSQIAVYKANSASDIMSNDTSKYDIIAANDDYYGEDKDYAALVYNVEVTPGKEYWLQVDGSACGDEGEFYINLIDSTFTPYIIPTSVAEVEDESVNIYPNPTSGRLSIEVDNQIVERIQIISMNGKALYIESLDNSSNDITIQIPEYLEDGLYILNILTESSSINKTLIIRR